MKYATALIDGDILLYKACLGTQTTIEWEDGFSIQKTDIQETEDRFKSLIKEALQYVGGSESTYILCLSGSTNFRKDVLPTYKENRKGLEKPALYHELKALALEKYHGVEWENIEADDMLGILATSGKYHAPVIVTIDKDLDQIPADRMNCDKEDFSKAEDREHDYLFMKQVLTGDPVDNFKGCPGIGDKRAAKALKDLKTPLEMWGVVKDLYESKGLTEADAITQARCAYILRHGDYNIKTKQVKLWEPPHE